MPHYMAIRTERCWILSFFFLVERVCKLNIPFLTILTSVLESKKKVKKKQWEIENPICTLRLSVDYPFTFSQYTVIVLFVAFYLLILCSFSLLTHTRIHIHTSSNFIHSSLISIHLHQPAIGNGVINSTLFILALSVSKRARVKTYIHNMDFRRLKWRVENGRLNTIGTEQNGRRME